MHIFLGIVLVIVGTFFVVKTSLIYDFFGSVGFAEKYLSSSGGSRFFYKLLGVFFIVIGFIIMLNLHLGTMDWIGRRMFGGYAPAPESHPSQLDNSEPQFDF